MKMRKISRILLAVITVYNLTSCTPKKADIIGTWKSTSISNPADLFKKTLPDRNPGTVIFTAGKKGTFTWQDKKDASHLTGSYTLEKDTMTLHALNEKPVVVKLKVTQEILILKTDDDFTYTFRRAQ